MLLFWDPQLTALNVCSRGSRFDFLFLCFGFGVLNHWVCVRIVCFSESEFKI